MAVDEANWKIEHQCPQCGAPVLLDETDRVLSCPFCRTRLYLVTPDHFRYCLSVPVQRDQTMVYVPYWRMKGLSFSIKRHEIGTRLIDTSILATDFAGFPRSLGVRPQTLNLKFAYPGMAGRFLETRLPPEAVIPADDALASAEKTFHRVFIGETISLLYAPAYIEHGILYDALLERPISAWPDDSASVAADVRPLNWQIRFMPTLCPHCGWDLLGEKDALVLTCNHCDSAWNYNGTKLTEVPFVVWPATGTNVAYLPFWRMKPRAEGVALDSYADLIRLANLPKVMKPGFASVPAYFWSPAFKVNPALFLRWSRQMTVYQPRGKVVSTFAGASCCSVTLSSREAVESMKITLAQMVFDKRRHYPHLDAMRLSADEILLEYHPFLVGSREFIHETMQISLDRTALKHGIYL
jgi:DNA-directed RNA polymerase subunit RPC12/RpoP